MSDLPLIGKSAAHCELLAILDKIANTDVEILISGPSGVGKDRYARYVHAHSSRNEAPFVSVSGGEFSDGLFENELFGHATGAFTDARAPSKGLVAEAEGGTLFLDEIDTLSLHNQVKLLRFVESKEYRRLGEARMHRADVRLIAATNIDLHAAVQAGLFRKDLFFRMRVVPIEVPALEDRPDDIQPLLDDFVKRFAAYYHHKPIRLTDEAMERLRNYEWSGNVRELENCVRYLTCLQLDRPVRAEDLPLLGQPAVPGARTDEEPPVAESFQESKRNVVIKFERDFLARALRISNGNIAQAARLSGKHRRAFFELMRKHDVKADEFLPDR